MRLLVPLWHMPEAAFAGGLYRAKRIVETIRGYDMVVIDSDTSNIDPSRVPGIYTTYPAKCLYAGSRWLFPVFRLINWLWSAAAIVAKQSRYPKLGAVYVPTSELPHVAFAGWVTARMRRVPLIFCNLNVRGTEFWAFNRRLHRDATAIITLSHALAEEIRNEGISVPIYVGTVGVDDHSVPPEKIEFDIIYIARHTREKGAEDMVHIASLCVRQKPSIKIAMVGPCNEAMRRRLSAMIDEAGIRDSVVLLGAVSEPEKWKLLARSRVCAFPSHVEGWGIVPIEAHLSGLPVVAYDLPAYEETIRYSPGASLVPVGDIEAFSNATIRAIEGQIDTTTIRSWARQFSWERAAHAEKEILAKILQT